MEFHYVEEAKDPNKKPLDYEAVVNSSKFKKLLQEKKKFIVPITIFFLLFYFSLPVLAVYTTVLDQPVIGDITGAWVLAFAQFIMTWVLCIIYVKKAAYFDKVAEEIIAEHTKEGK
ncbi:DUF485 domain-containing protein [Halalkalibacterium ligniniphilum]|uniref:DUF485 domain-containing protein n=1 Tax=Halalkalibacterium ligniniphilum TaxID=1134413 RepID=UPI00034CB0DC|nr:DUF485 domain-containing protein [Halalkalibacterium ligniniphilum]